MSKLVNIIVKYLLKTKKLNQYNIVKKNISKTALESNFVLNLIDSDFF